MNCDIFISYRRDGGDMTAMHINQALKERGYNVFYDLEVLRAGKFNEALLNAIDSCQDFVLVLSPHALDRCKDEGDWVRMEIAAALRKKKNIVPIMLNGFTFPETLPDEIDEIRFQNGLSATTEYFTESMDRLCNRYLISKPTQAQKKGAGKTGLIIGGIAGIAVLAVLILFATGVFGKKNPGSSAPEPTPEITAAPTAEPTPELTAAPTAEPMPELTAVLTAEPTPEITVAPTAEPTPEMTAVPISEMKDLPILMHNDPKGLDAGSIAKLPAFGGPWKREEINRIEFTTRKPGDDAWDVSERGDGSIMAWTEGDETYRTLLISSDLGMIRMPEISSGMFQSFTNADSIEFGGLVDFSRVVEATGAFSFSGFTTLDLSGADFQSLQNAAGLFQRLEQMKELNLTGIRMDHVDDTSWMFDGCALLESLDLSGLNTARVQNMSGMFYACESLRELDLRGFDTSRVQNMMNMFDKCRRMVRLRLEGWDTSRVMDMQFMFCECERLEDVDVSHFKTDRAICMNQMFEGCSGLMSLDVSGFDTSRVEGMSNMFHACSNLMKLDVTGFDTAQVTDMSGMFFGCTMLDSLDLSGFNTSAVTDMHEMFAFCQNILDLDLSSFDTDSVTDMTQMFCGMQELEHINLSSFNTSKVKSFRDMFGGCFLLNSVDVSKFDLSSAEDMTDMFKDCMRLTDIGMDPAAFGKGENIFVGTPLEAK